MNPVWMATMLVALAAAFVWSANRRWQLLKVGRDVDRTDNLIERLKGTYEYAFVQKKMNYYPLAGAAHKVIFIGFLALLLNSIILWGRGFDPTFSLFILGDEPVHLPVFGDVGVGHAYEFVKDVTASLVVLGTLVFLYYRVIKHERRMTLSGEGVLILGIILAMMIADMVYSGASMVLWHRYRDLRCGADDAAVCHRIAMLTARFHGAPEGPIAWSLYPAPAGSFFAKVLEDAGPEQLGLFALAGFWTHATLVMVFLNLLPHSKHFHIITAIPNVFARDIGPRGRLPYMGSQESIGEMVMAAAETPDTAEPVGAARIEDFTWKAILDFYTCTECGRCTDNCPAHKTGKMLSPKQLTLDLRDHL
ncbi:MAG TPA: (Fe-S)-binding protein, partial [Minicystis sp.]|nr:(Fe-S)-binding protein [Minicystis sp.]